MKTKMKVINIIKKADIETVAKIIGGVIVMHVDGISAKDAMENEYPATLKFLQTDMEIDYKPTNADRIRAMTDEELADYFISIGANNSEKILFCKSAPECTEILESEELIPDEMCRECLIKWLRSEVENN